MIPSKEKIEEIIKELQKIMRIQDWDISVSVLSREEFIKEHKSDEQAKIKISRYLNAAHIDINSDTTSNWYKSLLHELIHLAFDPIEQAGINACNLTSGNVSRCIDDDYTVAMERTVEKMAAIFNSVYPITNFIKEDDSNA
jgi:hypothetical protein